MKFRNLKLHQRLNLPLSLSLSAIAAPVLVALHYVSSQQISGLSEANISHLEALSVSNTAQLNDLIAIHARQLETMSANTIKQFEAFQVHAAEDILQASSRRSECLTPARNVPVSKLSRAVLFHPTRKARAFLYRLPARSTARERKVSQFKESVS